MEIMIYEIVSFFQSTIIHVAMQLSDVTIAVLKPEDRNYSRVGRGLGTMLDIDDYGCDSCIACCN